MKRLVVLMHKRNFGVGKTEEFARRLSNGNLFKPVSAGDAQLLLSLLGNDIPLVNNYPYYVFYAYHPSSGYHTHLYLNEQGVPEFKTHRPGGIVLNAFMSEIFVFSVVDE